MLALAFIMTVINQNAVTPVALPSSIVVILPFLATTVIAYLQQPDAKHPASLVINAVIAVVFFLLAGAACLLLGGPISNDWGFDAFTYLIFVALLMGSPPCKQLYQAILSALPTPLAALFDFFEQKLVPPQPPIQELSATLIKTPYSTSPELVVPVKTPNSSIPSIPPTTLPPGA